MERAVQLGKADPGILESLRRICVIEEERPNQAGNASPVRMNMESQSPQRVGINPGIMIEESAMRNNQRQPPEEEEKVFIDE